MNELAESLIENHPHYFRHFSWRENPEPYRLLVAEMMLRRTRAEQVEPVFVDFIKQYPTIFDLAKAEVETVASVTARLGLHWRGKDFVNAARFVVERYDGQIPQTRAELLEIPGVGDYVAGAILTAGYNLPEPVIDSNIARFFNRFYGLNLTGEIRRKKVIQQKTENLFECNKTRDLLFAFLDFTALVCKPQKPVCETCFLRQGCQFQASF